MAKRVAALGGGHGLAVTLTALTTLSVNVTAIVGVVDDGGSSGRIRRDLGLPPPGDLRMALAALSSAEADLWRRVLQHRFGTGDIQGHVLGNLLIAALWEETGDVVAGLDAVGAAIRARGRVLPACLEPVDLVVDIGDGEGETRVVRGQADINALHVPGRVITGLRIEPAEPRGCDEAIAALMEADAIVLGPGSWFTSVLPHLAVPGVADALVRTPAVRVLVLNLSAELGETSGFRAHTYLEVWADLFPEQRLDVVVADRSRTREPRLLEEAAARLGARVQYGDLARPGDGHGHDPAALGEALAEAARVAG